MPSPNTKRPPGSPDRRKKKGKRTVKNSTTSPRAIGVTATFKRKAEEAIQYRTLGYSFKQIGVEMKCDPSYAHRLVDWAMNREPVEGLEAMRRMQGARLEMLLTATLDRAFEGDAEAQDQARKTMDQIARLFGLNKPVQIEHSGEINGTTQALIVISADDAKL